MNILFIGLGAMGFPMMQRLAEAGHAVVAFDIDEGRRKRAGAVPGVRVAASLASAAATCSVVFTCLPSVRAVESVYLGAEGIAAALQPDALVIECSTIGWQATRRIAEAVAARGASFLESPLFGAEERACKGELFLLLGGDPAVIERATPLLELVASEWMQVGAVGHANAIKVGQNGLGLVQAAAIAVALRGVQRAGVDPAVFSEAVMRANGMAASPLFAHVVPRMLSESEPAYPVYSHIMLKDIELASELEQGHAGTGLLNAVRELIVQVQNKNLSADGFQALGRLPLGTGH